MPPLKKMDAEFYSVPRSDRFPTMTLPTEPIGSIPRPVELMNGMRAFGEGRIGKDALEALFDGAVRDTIRRLGRPEPPPVV